MKLEAFLSMAFRMLSIPQEAPLGFRVWGFGYRGSIRQTRRYGYPLISKLYILRWKAPSLHPDSKTALGGFGRLLICRTESSVDLCPDLPVSPNLREPM